MISEGTSIRYDGILPDGRSYAGVVTALIPDASGDGIATVQFDDGHRQDIPASELAPDPLDAPDERRRYAEARRDELLAAVREDREKATAAPAPSQAVTVDARRRVIATAGNRKGQRGIVTGPPEGHPKLYLPVDWADGTSSNYHKHDLDTVWHDPQCALPGCHAFFDGTTWYAVDSVLAAHEHSVPAAAHDEPAAGTYTFLPLAEAVNPSAGGLFTHYARSWWIIHPGKGLAFYHAPGRRRGRGSPQCNTDERITRMILAKTEPFPGAAIRYIESAWVPADPDDY